MNSTYKLVFSAVLNAWVAVAEHVRGRGKQGTVRLVFDLKADVKPEVFTLRPVAEYGHRLVMDIYPAQSTDPLITMLEKEIILFKPIYPSLKRLSKLF
jgi:hypothetical protein